MKIRWIEFNTKIKVSGIHNESMKEFVDEIVSESGATVEYKDFLTVAIISGGEIPVTKFQNGWNRRAA